MDSSRMWMGLVVEREKLECDGISQEHTGKQLIEATCILGLSPTKPRSGSSEQVSFPQLSL